MNISLKIAKTIAPLPLFLCLTGCISASSHRAQTDDTASGKVSVGTVQREIRVGMSGADVVSVLGSPNIVSTDDERREVWIYDKVATERVYSRSSGGITSLILGAGSAVLAGVGIQSSQDSGSEAVSQRTLTIIIKFDEASKVRDFAYHASRF